ncbi:hypothetical protein [Nostoc sp. FACHB-190]|uniref:hypothetical protein n=1 Tax=Nostoc sp. FACHB-190 TaxID=2692838 RepID=UPI001689CCAD|nr:hypothetical protein [Nostoc sp. FACHB-190]MBD2301056.1 hypothetical protein [Nostoc sp. FACHB-190]
MYAPLSLIRLHSLRNVRLDLKPNPQPLPYKGRGARIKASLRCGYRVHTSLEILPNVWFCRLALGCAIALESLSLRGETT